MAISLSPPYTGTWTVIVHAPFVCVCGGGSFPEDGTVYSQLMQLSQIVKSIALFQNFAPPSLNPKGHVQCSTLQHRAMMQTAFQAKRHPFSKCQLKKSNNESMHDNHPPEDENDCPKVS